MPQALKRAAPEHIKMLKRRNTIGKSDLKWSNPDRYLKKPNEDIRLAVNMMKFNDLAKKDPLCTEYKENFNSDL